jgi:tRNA nucleotidyltransferase (CCA-adding enzyme)
VLRPSPDDLWQRFSALPAARPLRYRLGDAEGVYVVGGAVRDLMLGRPSPDLDLVVDGELGPIADLLGTPARVHDRFATATVLLDGFSYDLARARRESYERPGALPTVSPATIDEDLQRRDFTVNALAFGLGGRRRGELLAVPHGLDDLQRGRLRVLHDASFIDDPTRLLRLARYAGRLGFTIEDRTRTLAADAVATRAVDTVSGPRVGAELRLLAAEPDPIAEFRKLGELGADAAIEPGLGLRSARAAGLATRALALLPDDGDRGVTVLAVACRGVEADRLGALLDRLGFTAAARGTITAAVTRSDALARALGAASRPSDIAAAVAGAPVEVVALAGALAEAEGADAARDAAGRWLAELRHVRLEIGGEDLLAAGIPQGPAVGAGLAGALAAKLDGRAEGRDAELAAALAAASGVEDW